MERNTDDIRNIRALVVALIHWCGREVLNLRTRPVLKHGPFRHRVVRFGACFVLLEGEVAFDTGADSARFAARSARPDLGVNASVEISRCRSNSVAKPEVARIRIESRVPGH